MRIESNEVVRVDALCARFLVRGRKARRADVLRVLITRGLEAVETDATTAPFNVA